MRHCIAPLGTLWMREYRRPVYDGVAKEPKEVILQGPVHVVLWQYELPARDRAAALHAEAEHKVIRGLVDMHPWLQD